MSDPKKPGLIRRLWRWFFSPGGVISLGVLLIVGFVGGVVRATCPDCHVPKDWGPKMIRKIKASKELYGHFVTKSIWTPEKFDAMRLELASHEWARMKRNDLQECRNCHSFDFMDLTYQENRAADAHHTAMSAGKTCIDCHQGIAHDLPAGYLERYRAVVAGIEGQ